MHRTSISAIGENKFLGIAMIICRCKSNLLSFYSTVFWPVDGAVRMRAFENSITSPLSEVTCRFVEHSILPLALN
jgi:hypothetical protein